jgi:hypothetical protein
MCKDVIWFAAAKVQLFPDKQDGMAEKNMEARNAGKTLANGIKVVTLPADC